MEETGKAVGARLDALEAAERTLEARATDTRTELARERNQVRGALHCGRRLRAHASHTVKEICSDMHVQKIHGSDSDVQTFVATQSSGSTRRSELCACACVHVCMCVHVLACVCACACVYVRVCTTPSDPSSSQTTAALRASIAASVAAVRRGLEAALAAEGARQAAALAGESGGDEAQIAALRAAETAATANYTGQVRRRGAPTAVGLLGLQSKVGERDAAACGMPLQGIHARGLRNRFPECMIYLK
jgi:hypothetical protein